ncbi:MAG: toll/interleukin-1 receptor domain-containing protein [Acidobacteria bacterium]|nr:toll/interleukin-1 receptor domain-containing protein [Acidobacteriota bacterium]
MLTEGPDNRNEDQLYVFISYAKQDIEIAEKVESFLIASGFRVFRDPSDIRTSEHLG